MRSKVFFSHRILVGILLVSVLACWQNNDGNGRAYGLPTLKLISDSDDVHDDGVGEEINDG
jgi:hypothetical protein